MIGAESGHVKVVEVLIRHGAEVKAVESALILAAQKGHLELVEALLRGGIHLKNDVCPLAARLPIKVLTLNLKP